MQLRQIPKSKYLNPVKLREMQKAVSARQTSTRLFSRKELPSLITFRYRMTQKSSMNKNVDYVFIAIPK